MDKQEITAQRRKHSNRNVGGLILLVIGVFLLLDKLDLDIPHWIVTWPCMMIFLGIIIGIKQNFRSFGWLIMIAVGSAFLFKEIAPDYFEIKQELLWPIILIVVGGALYLKNSFDNCGTDEDRKRKWENKRNKWEKWHNSPMWNPHVQGHRPPVPPPPPIPGTPGDDFANAGYQKPPQPNVVPTDDDYIYSSAIFSSLNKIVVSKNFQGGSLSAIFGGVELNLMQADFTGTAELNVSCIFGGMEIIVPGNWTVRLEEVTIFGGAEDSRPASLLSPDPKKVLIIRGSCIFGGLEIKSY